MLEIDARYNGMPPGAIESGYSQLHEGSAEVCLNGSHAPLTYATSERPRVSSRGEPGPHAHHWADGHDGPSDAHVIGMCARVPWCSSEEGVSTWLPCSKSRS
jgi:hypothetical protein